VLNEGENMQFPFIVKKSYGNRVINQYFYCKFASRLLPVSADRMERWHEDFSEWRFLSHGNPPVTREYPNVITLIETNMLEFGAL
jgi:hypothetical protein